MPSILRALRLFRRERGLWVSAVKPLLWGALAYVVVVLTTTLLAERVGERLGGGLGGALGAIAGLVLTIVLSGTIYLALVALIAGFGFDRLSMEVEEREFGRAVGQPLGFAAGIGDGVGRAVLTGLLGIVALCGGATVVIPWLVAAFLCLMDFTAPSLLRRGVGLGRQFGAARRLPGAGSFALVAGAFMLVPVVNVLALPILVAAGTILVAQDGKG